MTTTTVTLRCPSCGSDKFKDPPAKPEAEDLLVCASCGASNRYDEVARSAALKHGKKVAEDLVRDAFKGVKGFKFTPKG